MNLNSSMLMSISKEELADELKRRGIASWNIKKFNEALAFKSLARAVQYVLL